MRGACGLGSGFGRLRRPRHWLGLVALLVSQPSSVAAAAGTSDRPNFVVIVADDLGYGDLGCYGNPDIRTPALDRMAAEGVRMTEFYTPAPTCSPARAAMLTGRHPLRTGLTRVFIPKEVQGLPASEITLAEHLREAGYTTACIGKWHLGGRKRYRPSRHGFDEFFGVLYSNNMVWLKRVQWPRFELFDGGRVIESPADHSLLTRRYTGRSLEFLDRHQEKPFFLYVSYSMPHLPLAASREFAGRSGYGVYGDVVEEIDASVGQLLAKLVELDLDEDTVVLFTSDNGPWTGDGDTKGGSTGGLRGQKGTTWEGGLRIPFLARAPGRLPAGEDRSGPATLLDLFPTISALAGMPMPTDRRYDGNNILPLLAGTVAMTDRLLVFSNRRQVNAVRSGQWKLHLRERALDKKGRARRPRNLPAPLLYRLDDDPTESTDVAAAHPEVVERLRDAADRFGAGIEPVVTLRPFGRALVRGLFTPAW